MIHKSIVLEVPYEKYDCKKSDKKATLTTYVLRDFDDHGIVRMRPAIVICPGGGYEYVSEREAEAVALQYNARGFHAFIVDYSVAPDFYPCQLMEVAKAIAIVRQHAEEWHIDINKIVVSGFSAGGHLAASLGVSWNQKWLAEDLGVSNSEIKVNGLLLCYPVITSGEYAHRGSFTCLQGERSESILEMCSLEKQVTKDTPKTFLWHTMSDETVPVENSLMFINALHQEGISVEAHLFPWGRHGLALANEETSTSPDRSDTQKECQIWIELAEAWLKNI